MANVTRYKTSKGETRYRVRYRKPDGTQTDKRGFKRKIDAENWAAKRVTVAKAEGTYIDPAAGKTTVGELGPAWLAKKKLSTKPSHYRNLEGAWEKWVKPEWGNTPVSAVTRETVQQWVTGISQGKTVKDERGNLIAHVNVLIPTKLNETERGLIEQFAASHDSGATHVSQASRPQAGQKKGFFSKLKDALS